MTESPREYELERKLAEVWPVADWRDTHVVLGVSGGADSVAMLRAMAAIKTRSGGRGNLYVAHLNHGLRADAADADESWLRTLCESLQVMLQVEKRNVTAIADDHGDGWEAAARLARYDFLRSAAERMGARFVATAHTASDQVETVLHRILRGTGIEGLGGISIARPLTPAIALVRPMLGVNRDEVFEYLSSFGQDYRTDETNEDTRWTRNRLRHDLLPQLRAEYNPKVDVALLRLGDQAGEAQQVVMQLALAFGNKCVRLSAQQIKIDCRLLPDQPAIVVREVFKLAWRQAGWGEQAMGFDEWKQLANLATGKVSQTLNLPGGRRAKRAGQTVTLDVLAGQPTSLDR